MHSKARLIVFAGSAVLSCLAVSIPTETRAQSAIPAAADFQLAEGFVVDLVYAVPQDFGSWVSLTTTPDGLVASDQYGELYRIRPGDSVTETTVTPIDVELGHAQGLLWAFDCLYVMAHRKDDETPGGLYRVTDSSGDGRLDQSELLREIEGGGEHGPHAVILGPDGKSLYVCAGNHTALTEISSSRVPQNWQEDNLLARIWDPGGHAVGLMAPGGWICKTDPDGRQFELTSIGYRNQYDIAFSPAGELFTFDADMEWDIGTPWYRPTRVCHATDGSEFGWRGGDAKWPPYYPDNLPPTVEIGPGSPTGVVFGTGTQFPEKYQRALFIADWSFGFIYAIHLTPDGATWSGEKELFCSAAALQVTDMIVHEGDLFFAIGGRRTQSALYRIQAAEPVTTVAPPIELTSKQKLRRRLESSDFGDQSPLEFAWPYLNHPDRAIRYAARIVLERTPIEQWLERALTETATRPVLESLLAVCRSATADAETQKRVMQSIQKNLSWESLSQNEKLHLLRVCGLMLMRLDPENSETNVRELLGGYLAGHYPAETEPLNREMCRLLVAIGDPQVVPVTMQLLETADTQEQQISYVMSLRLADVGWTPDLRERYLQWFAESAVFQGGKSFAGYLRKAREEFIERLTDDQRTSLAALIEIPLNEQDPYASLRGRPVIRDWAFDELLPAIRNVQWHQRDIENGRSVFATAQCYKCHQFNGSGGIVGPDLTGLSRRYSAEYLLETLIDPDKAISSQYQATVFEMADGKIVTGRVANLNGNHYQVQTDMITPGKLTSVNRDEIEDLRPSLNSPMPEDLLNSFTEDEILDLLAFLRSGLAADD